ncbi:DUF2470 domain-containing protein [Allonocardiopsis opalescens]|uniref:Uncharacterized protein DUF2470 n=1 Tax=Allonocardiopsis opalescens TaxID=1144618 RepID=A0A2T0Q062_9ACTN|nr:DUF2470 domain-containing protein [Allonocardiopsis opalescens]PRX97053.1 uncharacterized protein DUF2470 [Allonocardiopsis opalescens]
MIYDTYDAGGVLDGGAFLAAEPDPLAGAAERLLAHVNDRHRDELSAALAHIPGAPEGRAWLWELDRHGSTLWVQPLPRPAEPGAGCGPVLIRLPWSAPAEHPRDLERALHDLMHARPAPKVR